MNKFIFAFVAFLAVAQAKPYVNNQYGAVPVQSSYAVPSLAYQAVPVQASYSVPSSYGKPSSYGNPSSYGTQIIQLQPIALPISSSNYGGYAAPTPLVAAPSNPSASAAAAAAASQLNSGKYAQLAIPSYEYISGIPGNTGSSYGVPSAPY